MEQLLSRRRILHLIGAASATVGSASTPALADSEPAVDIRTITVNGQAFTGYWASQLDTPGASGEQ